jgi:hypothetical protein
MTLEELLERKQAQKRPRIVVHCGSTTRACAAFEEWRLRDTLQGMIVLTVGANKSDREIGVTSEQAAQLDLLHLWKIEMADLVRVLNVGGYIGESTVREVAYAQRLGKQMVFLEYAPVVLPGVVCAMCRKEQRLYPCAYCCGLVCRACSLDATEHDTLFFGIPIGQWMCPVCVYR